MAAATIVAVASSGIGSGWAAQPTRTESGPGWPEVTGGSPVKSVTLITGDRVTLSGKNGTDVGIVRAEGRRVTFHTHRKAGKVRVVPSDAVGLLASGRLDPRLFEVTELIESGYGDDRSRSLPLIVTYDGPAGRSSVRSPGVARVRELPSVNGTAVRITKGTNLLGSLPVTGRRFGGGIERIWLDGKRRVVLDQSVPQIGGPAAWQAGYTGEGVTVAILDTGIDNTHPDLADRVAEARNFTAGPAGDQVGHGTHVASTIAGTGAGADGRYKGVAHESRLLDGKVCGDQLCEESAILAGMQWAAVEKDADVINVSLGGGDTPGVDPLEEAVNTLTAQTGALFVVAAGNSGPEAGTVESPGSADAALTVGAVDKADGIAPFSSRGPRAGDDAVKPDVTAPGVDVVAARSKDGVVGDPVGEQYSRMSGTSMATPHTAGAAALLAQQHPDWTAAELKATLMASAKSHDQQSAFDQGTGRVDLARAIRQTVFAQPASVAFGVAAFPHGDDEPVVRQLTFRNTGSADTTLALEAALTGPAGDPAPAGALALSATSVVVPAGGSAAVTVTSNTAHDGPDGVYTGRITATGAATGPVVVPLSLERESERYDLTVTHLDPSGTPTGNASTWITGIDTDTFAVVDSPDGVAKVRLPKGRYYLEGYVTVDLGNGRTALHTLIQPVLEVDKDTALAIDARLTKPVTTVIPRPDAGLWYYQQNSVVTVGDYPVGSSVISLDDIDLFTAPLGPPLPAGQFRAGLSSVWVAGNGSGGNSPYSYHLMNTRQGSYWHGFSRRVQDRELAKISAKHYWQAGDRQVLKFLYGYSADGVGGSAGTLPGYTLPSTPTHYVEAGGATWRTEYTEIGLDLLPVTILASSYRPYQAGKEYHERWNAAVFGPTVEPVFPEDRYAYRTGDRVFVSLPTYSDAEHAGGSLTDGGSSKLYRDGELISESDYGAFVEAENVPADLADFKLVSTLSRPSVSNLSTRMDLEWTFKSRNADNEALPLWAVRYAPPVDIRNTVKRQPVGIVPLRLESVPGAKVGSLKKVDVQVSGDDGLTWTRATVRQTADKRYAAVFRTPAGGYVSLKAQVADSDGNTTEQTIIRAYALR